jgi:hypothetical protein
LLDRAKLAPVRLGGVCEQLLLQTATVHKFPVLHKFTLLLCQQAASVQSSPGWQEQVQAKEEIRLIHRKRGLMYRLKTSKAQADE